MGPFHMVIDKHLRDAKPRRHLVVDYNPSGFRISGSKARFFWVLGPKYQSDSSVGPEAPLFEFLDT